MARIKYYNKAGDRLPGVTTVLGKMGLSTGALMWWANQEGLAGRGIRDSSKIATDIGTHVHSGVEADLKGEPLDEIIKDFDELLKINAINEDQRKQIQNAFQSWLDWKSEVHFELVASEKQLVSEHYQVGGTLDIAAVQSKRCLIDLKTAKGVYHEHMAQLAAYGQIWAENYPDQPFERFSLLQLGKVDGSFHYHSWPELDGYLGLFEAALAVYNAEKDCNKRYGKR